MEKVHQDGKLSFVWWNSIRVHIFKPNQSRG